MNNNGSNLLAELEDLLKYEDDLELLKAIATAIELAIPKDTMDPFELTLLNRVWVKVMIMESAV